VTEENKNWADQPQEHKNWADQSQEHKNWADQSQEHNKNWAGQSQKSWAELQQAAKAWAELELMEEKLDPLNILGLRKTFCTITVCMVESSLQRIFCSPFLKGQCHEMVIEMSPWSSGLGLN
jgi:hypothetical protein